MSIETVIKRTIGIIIIAILLGLAFQSAEASEAGIKGTEWKSFVLHIREGAVEGAVVGGKCLGRDAEGNVRTVGCARRRASPPEAWLDGECWITVRKWDPEIIRAVLENWGHELAHCVGKKHDDSGTVWYE